MNPPAKIAIQASAIVSIFASGSRLAMSDPSTSIAAINR
jgi:hypothetical protein